MILVHFCKKKDKPVHFHNMFSILRGTRMQPFNFSQRLFGLQDSSKV